MRIAISGTSNVGKTTLLRDFLKEWPSYSTSEGSYRDDIKGDDHSKGTNKATQWKILNSMIDQLMASSKEDNVVYDRSLLDNIVYSMWSFDKGEGDIDGKFIKKCIGLVKESIKFYDVIFFIPITKASPIEAKKDGTRETDPFYIKEIDSIFKAIMFDWNENAESKLCDPQDRPALIEIFGNPRERIEMIKLYLDMDGDAIDNTNIMDSLGDFKTGSGLSLPYQ